MGMRSWRTGNSTIEAALAGMVRAPVVALTDAVLRTMALGRLKLAVRVLFTVGITTAVGWVGMHRELRPWAVTVQSSKSGCPMIP